MFKESTELGCVAKFSFPRKSILREPGKIGSKHRVKFSKGTWHQINIRERKGPSRGIIPKCELHERSPCAPKFGERSHEETLTQERCARKAAWHLARNIHKLKNSDETVFYVLGEVKGMTTPLTSEETRRTKIRSRFRSIDAHDEQKRIKLRRILDGKKVQNNNSSGVDCKR